MQPVKFRSKGIHGQRTSSCRKQRHIYLPERNFTFLAKIQCKNIPQNVYVTKFLSFSSDDHDFVLDNVFPMLDEGLNGILTVESRCVATGDLDMLPDHPIQHEIIKCLEKSTVVIFFVTRSFCKHRWCKFEFDTAIQIKKPAILMMYGNVKKRHMPPVLRTHFETYVRVHWSIQNGVPVMTPGCDVVCKTIVRLIAAHPRPTTEDDSESGDGNNGDKK